MTRRNATSPLDAMRSAGGTGRPGRAGPAASGRVGGHAPTPPVLRFLARRTAGAASWLRAAAARVTRAPRGPATPLGTGGASPADRFADACAGVRDAVAARVGEVWWIGSAEPVTLRLPRGVTVLVVAGVVGIIGLAFVAGRRTGQAPAAVAWEPPRSTVPERLAGVDPVPTRVALAALGGDDVPGGGDLSRRGGRSAAAAAGTHAAGDPAGRLQARFDAGLDPRVDGLNYLVYITATRRECLRLADFLGERGVQAVVMRSSRSVREEADGEVLELPLYWVVDVGRGFSRTEYLRGEHAAFRDERMELGRAWKRHNGGRGSDLADMQFYAYRVSPSAS